jgi:hypothetical protein
MRWFLVLGVVGLSVAAWALRVVPELRVFGSPDGLPFVLFDGVTPPDAGVSSFTIQNVGRAQLNVTSIELYGDDAGVFAIEGSPVPSLTPGDSEVVTVRFSPTVPGKYSARVLIESDDPLRRNEDLVLCGWGYTGGPAPQCEAPSPPPLPALTPPARGCSSVGSVVPLMAALLLIRRRRPTRGPRRERSPAAGMTDEPKKPRPKRETR